VVVALDHEWACETIQAQAEVGKAQLVEEAVPSYELVAAASLMVAAVAAVACTVAVALLD